MHRHATSRDGSLLDLGSGEVITALFDDAEIIPIPH